MKFEENLLKPNYIGIIGAIIAFISLILPWWAMSESSSISLYSFSLDVSVYLYQTTAQMTGVVTGTTFALANSWYLWAALALVVIGALLALAGSVMGKGRMLLIGGGLLTIIGIIVFAAGLMMDLSNMSGFAGIGLFNSGTIDLGGFGSASFSTYLSYGFWLALVAAILMFIGAFWKPKEAMATPPTAPPAPTP